MGDTQIYSVFLDNPPNEQFLFKFRQSPETRPQKGDSVTDPISQREFKIMRDEFTGADGEPRITEDGFLRITEDGFIRITNTTESENVTHNYFVQPANNKNRVATWTTSRFDDDQTLRQLN